MNNSEIGDSQTKNNLYLRHHLPEHIHQAKKEMSKQLNALKSVSFNQTSQRVRAGGFVLKKISQH